MAIAVSFNRKLPRLASIPPIILLTFLLVIDIIVLWLFWSPTNTDLTDYALKWYIFLRQHGFAALGTDFSNYTPPYLYLLGLGTLADGLVAPATIIRGLSVAFNGLAAVLVFHVVRSWGRPRGHALLAACLFFLLPELLVNSAVWGQCDIIYTLFLIACVHFAIERRGWAAMAMLGVALAFKAQATFIAPFILYLLLSRQVRWRQLVAVPLVCGALMVPAALAGRPWRELLTIYLGQADYFQSLTMWAPNPYLVVRALLPDSPQVVGIGTAIGLLLGVATVIALALIFLRLEGGPRRERLLLMATLSLAAMPYVLPRMHERYFLPAGAMAFLLAVESPAAWPVAAMIQAADLAAYTGFLLAKHTHVLLALAAIVMTAAIVSLIALLLERRAAGDAALAPAARSSA